MRPPARTDLHAGELNWRALDEQTTSWLAPLLAQFPGELRGVFAGDEGCQLAYLCLSRDDPGHPDGFIKLIPDACVEQEALVAQLGRSLIGHGVDTPALQGVQPLSGGMHAFVYDWVQGRHPSGFLTQMALLGRSVASLHRGLRHVADQYDVVRRTQERLQSFSRLATSPRFTSFWVQHGQEDWALRCRDAFFDETERMLTCASPCHGDLNPGNLLVRDGGCVSFIDLEDALHTAVWPGFDLAKLVERLVLPTAMGMNVDEVEQSISTLVRSYVDAGGLELGIELQPGHGRFAGAMRWHLGLAVLVLTANEKIEQTVLRREVSKFKAVGNLIDQWGDLL